MPLFSYEAVDRAGKKVRASADAADESTLKAELQGKGLMPLAISAAERKRSFGIRKVTGKDLLLFSRELASLLEAGLPLDRALLVLSQHSENEALGAVVKQIYIDIQHGQSLSQALSKHKIFPKLYVNMIRAGEMGGILEQVLKRLAVFFETTAAFKEEIISALIYPLLLTSVGGMAVTVLMLYVVPRFAKIFEDMGQALPLPTRILMGTSDWLLSYWWGIALAAGVSVMLALSYARTAEGRLFMDGLKLRAPVIRGIHLKLVIARFTRTLATLLQSGVPILEAVKVSRDVTGNEVVSRRLAAVEEGIGKGRGVSAPLEESGVFPPIVTQMIAVGEEAGRLEETFIMVAERFEAETRTMIKRTIGLIEPALILVMGLVVGFIVISMLVAVFSIHEIPF